MRAGLHIGVVAAALVGCGSASVTQTIGASGGTITSPDGLTVAIPSGALGQNVAITVTQSATTSPDAVGPAFLLGPEGQTFSQPVQVVLPFNAGRLSPGLTAADIDIETAPRGSGAFTSLGASVVDGSHVQTMTTHFSIFVAVAHPQSIEDGGVSDLFSSPDGGGCAVLSSSCTSAGQCCSAYCDPNAHVCASPVCAGIGSSCGQGTDCCTLNCNGGRCGCSAGLTDCFGTCVDLNNNAANCGGCGAACPTGEICNGTCVAAGF